MKRHELAQLALEVAALVVAITGIAQLPFWFISWDAMWIVIALATPLWMLVLAAVIYWMSGPIARRLFPDRDGVIGLSLEDGQTLAWGMLGAWTLIPPLQFLVLAGFLVVFGRFLPDLVVGEARETWSSPGALLGLGTRAVLGVGLLLGAKGLATLWERVQVRDSQAIVAEPAGRVPAEWLARALAVLGVWLVVDGGTGAAASWVDGSGILDSTILWGHAAVIASLVRMGLGIALFALSRRLATYWAGLRFDGEPRSFANGTTT